jgi:glycosyltransferase involved in cell wall biosynthesis
MKISFVLPVFNNEETIAAAVGEIMDLSMNQISMHQIEIICIDDGSTDNSWEILTDLSKKNLGIVRSLKLSRNFGQLAATLCGYKHAIGDAVITISADLQDPLSLVPSLIKEYEDGNEVVIAFRVERHDGFLRKFTSGIAYRLAGKDDSGFPKGGFDYTLLGRRAIDKILTFEGRHRFLQSDILYVGFKRKYLPYTRNKAHEGKSGYTFSKRIKIFVDLMLDSSYSLIKSITRLGMFIGLIGFLCALYLVFVKLFSTDSVPGWTFIVVSILVNSGIIIFILGLLAEYQWRIYDQLRTKPLYIVDEIL